MSDNSSMQPNPTLGRNWIHEDQEYAFGQNPSTGEMISPFEELLTEALNIIGDITYGQELDTRTLRSLKEFIEKQNFSPDDPLYATISWLGIFTAIFIQVPNATQRHLQSCMSRANGELQGQLDLVLSQSRQQLQADMDHLTDRIDDMSQGMKGFKEVFDTCMNKGGRTLAEILVAPKVLDEIQKMILSLQAEQTAAVIAREQELTIKFDHYHQQYLEQIAGLEQLKVDLLHTVSQSVGEQITKGVRVPTTGTSSSPAVLNFGRWAWIGALALSLLGAGFGFFISKSEMNLSAEQVAQIQWAKSNKGVNLRRLARLNPGIDNGDCPSSSSSNKISVNGKPLAAGWCLIQVKPGQND
jgi:hypothetical protein